jgi:uncharacterized lipoprotein YddW (UPF0748 family)
MARFFRDQPESGLVSPWLSALERIKIVEKYWLDGAFAEASGYFSTDVASVVEKYWHDGALAEECGYFAT